MLSVDTDFKVVLAHPMCNKKVNKKYLAPEIRNEDSDNHEKADIYSFGVVLDELIKVFRNGNVWVFDEDIVSLMTKSK